MDYTRGNHSHRACRTICDRHENKIKRSTCQSVLDQVIKECFKVAIMWLIEE